MTISEQIDKWIQEQYASGKTRDELSGTQFVKGNTVCVLTKSGKTKFNLKCSVGKVVILPTEQ